MRTGFNREDDKNPRENRTVQGIGECVTESKNNSGEIDMFIVNTGAELALW
jgi:hypothetical protein